MRSVLHTLSCHHQGDCNCVSSCSLGLITSPKWLHLALLGPETEHEGDTAQQVAGGGQYCDVPLNLPKGSNIKMGCESCFAAYHGPRQL